MDDSMARISALQMMSPHYETVNHFIARVLLTSHCVSSWAVSGNKPNSGGRLPDVEGVIMV